MSPSSDIFRSKIHRARHIDRLASIARLHSVNCAPPNSCRVLDIGCGCGEALLFSAELYPESTFVGIDSSNEAISSAIEMRQSLGLKNVEFVCGDLSCFSAEEFSYDYVVCHGVFSWVPPKVSRKILEIVAQVLSETGVFYVSYNTLPGWYLKETIRDSLSSCLSGFSQEEYSKQCLEFLSLLGEAAGYAFERPFSLMLSREVNRIEEESESYFKYELLSQETSAIYLKDFLNLVGSFGLSYISESRFSRTAIGKFILAETGSILKKLDSFGINSFIDIEQFSDFAFFNSFRESILVRCGAGPTEDIKKDQLDTFFFFSNFKPVSGIVETENSVQDFKNDNGTVVSVNDINERKVLGFLSSNWPYRKSFGEISESVGVSADILKEIITHLLYREWIDLSCDLENLKSSPHTFVRPRSSNFSRIQALKGFLVTNLNFDTVMLEGFELELLPLLDGSKDKETLCAELLKLLQSDGAEIYEDGVPISDPTKQEMLVSKLLEDALKTLERAALLCPP